MPNYNYLIIGGGMTADAAVRGIRERDPQGSIGLIGAEAQPPYNRPPLSKGLWQDQPLEDIWRGTDEWNVNLHLQRRATVIDPLQKTVADDAGATYGYEKLLLATGGTPRRLVGQDDGVIYFRTLEDYHKLEELTRQPRQVAVIGAGFIGAELAAALRMKGHDVHMIFPDDALLTRVFPAALANHVNQYYENKGVTLHPQRLVKGVVRQGERYQLTMDDGSTLEVDGVVAGLGLEPNTEIAEAAGLTVGNGIHVNAQLQTSNDYIYAAGDVANIYDPVLGRRVRNEHEDNANSMGQYAGMAMAGHSEPYRHLPFFYSDLFDLGFEAVGVVDARLETAYDWAKPYQEGVIYYLNKGRVQGVLLWNTWGKLEAARKLIQSQRSVTADTVFGLLEESAGIVHG